MIRINDELFFNILDFISRKDGEMVWIMDRVISNYEFIWSISDIGWVVIEDVEFIKFLKLEGILKLDLSLSGGFLLVLI